jgi:leucyl aminopeptidase
MQISFAASPAKIPSGSWVVGASAGGELHPAALRADKASGGALSRGLKVSRFTGKSGQILEVLAPQGLAVSRILLVGLGKPSELDEKGLETIGAQIVARLDTLGETLAVLEIEGAKGAKVKSGEIAAHLAFGAKLRSYSFDKYRTQNLDEYKKRLTEIRVGPRMSPRPSAPMRASAPWRTVFSWRAIWSMNRRMFFIRRNSPAASRR